MNGEKARPAITVLLVTPVLISALLGGASYAAAQAKPDGEMKWALYVTVSPNWFDPGEVVGQLTPFWILYGMHDALVKPMPGSHMTPSLAESWTVSPDGWSAPLEDVRLKKR